MSKGRKRQCGSRCKSSLEAEYCPETNQKVICLNKKAPLQEKSVLTVLAKVLFSFKCYIKES